MSETKERLAAEFGDSLVLREPGSGDSLDGMAPQVVAAPRDEAAAQAVVAYCGREKLATIPRGGGTSWNVGARPAAFDVLLSSEMLTAVFEHDEGNATVSAGAGITLTELNAAVGQAGQFVAIEAPGAATLGGVVAGNRFGGSRLKYGMPRDQVVGLSAVLSDGRLIKAGSKVVKNVSGYDLNKLFIGSLGSLGFITGVIIRTRPFDSAHAEWHNVYSSLDAAATAAFEIVDGAFEPTALRLACEGDRFELHARFDGVQASLDAQLGRLPAPTNSAGPAESTESVESFGDEPGAPVSLRATLLLRHAPGWIRLARDCGAAKIVWDCGLGVVRADFEILPDVAALRAAATAGAGFAVVERAAPEGKTPELVWGAPDSAFALRRALKAKYDAANVFSPGRGVGGL